MGTYTDLLATSSLFCRLLDDSHHHEQDLRDEHKEDESIDVHCEDEEEESVDSDHQQSIINSPERGDELLVPSPSVETKEKGRLKWHVYVSYLRSGAGIVIGFLLVTVVSAAQQGAYIFGNWWLAGWNDDESYRHENFNSCSTIEQHKTIWSMTDDQWNDYRNRRFYIYCGLDTFDELIE